MRPVCSYAWNQHCAAGLFFLALWIRSSSQHMYGGELVSEYEILPSFPEDLKNITVARGRDVRLRCIIDNLADYRPAWIRIENKAILSIQHQVISRNPRLSLVSKDHRYFDLIIRNVQEADRGGYMCQVNTSPLISQVAYLDVLVPPDMVVSECSSDMTVREGANVTLVCKANGYPKPKISWRREDNEPIPLSSFFYTKKTQQRVNMYTGEELEIARVSRVHMGAYLCIASNNVPSPVSRRIVLYVHFSPVIWCPQQLIGVPQGASLALDCFAESYPVASVKWLKDGVLLSDRRYKNSTIKVSNYKVHSKLQIDEVKDDFGFYKCVAENSLGYTEGSIQIYQVAATMRQHASATAFEDLKSAEDSNQESNFIVDNIIPKELNQRANSRMLRPMWCIITVALFLLRHAGR